MFPSVRSRLRISRIVTDGRPDTNRNRAVRSRKVGPLLIVAAVVE
jgi:hypothetical protein